MVSPAGWEEWQAVAASPLYALDVRPFLARFFPAAARLTEEHLALFSMAGLLLTLSFLLSLFYIREQPKAAPLEPAGEAAR